MKILGIETTCDETAASVVQDGRRALSNVVASQAKIHAQYGGVVPEVAAREHIQAIVPVIDTALTEAKTTWEEINGIAVANGPGLMGSLLVGTMAAKSLAIAKHKPLYAVNHVVAHTYANFLIEPQPQFPLLALSVSGGHSHLIWFDDYLDYRLLGQTRDDAAGEAFDKVAALLGLPYPGGPAIDQAAQSGDPEAFGFPHPNLGDSFDFSFSGLKTAVLRQGQQLAGGDYTMPSTAVAAKLTGQQVNDVAASFQKTVCGILAGTLSRAYTEFKPRSVVIAGGVAANLTLRQAVSDCLSVEMHYAPMQFCTDNGAMIAALGYRLAKAGRDVRPADLKADPSLAV